MLGSTCFLLLLPGLVASWATSQCESDQVAHVQKNLKAVKVGALEQEVSGRICSISDLNSGDCVGTSANPKCTDCNPTGGQVIPTTGTGFPPGSLSCGEGSCRFEDDAPSNAFYEFRNSTDYLTCEGENACRRFNVRNAASICCGGPSSTTCSNSAFQLHGDHSCGGDVCCGRNCRQSSFTAVRNMACIGSQACRRASVSLAGDLFVGDTDGSTSGTNPFAGRLANFHFTTAGNHCVQTLGGGTGVAQSALRDATLTFEQPSNVRMLCQQGQTPCPGVKVLLPRGSCFHVNCDAESCEDFEVLPLVDGETDFRCYCNYNGGTSCAWTDNYDYCETLTAANSSNPCGTDICPGTSPVCMDEDMGGTFINCSLLDAPAPACDGSVTGDPHLRTLDGRHYTLMQQGNFLLWGFSGYEIDEIDVGNSSSPRKLPVDFEIFTHYAGHASFTKGFLLVALEVTAKDCLWHHWDTSAWRPVDSARLNMADSDGIQFGSFELAKSKGGRKLTLLISHKGMVRTLAQLWVNCRPGHQLSAKIKMSSPKDLHFVRGELAPGRLSLATGLGGEVNGMSTDAEFAVTSDWAALGGSPAAASYFKMVDTTGRGLNLMECSQEDKEKHAKTCRKYLGDSTDALHKEVMDDCIFDLCSGGGETSAELAAEILRAE